MKAANDEIQSSQKNGTWKEAPITDAKTRTLPGTWFFYVSALPMAPSASTKHGSVYGEIFKKLSRKPSPQSWLGAPYGCSSYCRSHYAGKPAPSTSAAPLSKLCSRTRFGSTYHSTSLPKLARTSRLPLVKSPGYATAQRRATPPPSRLLFDIYTAPAKWA